MESIKMAEFGPIKELNIELGDLTILLGPQASGKTLFLQMLKLILDRNHIVETLTRYNYVIDKQPNKILDYYFGDRLSSMWDAKTKIKYNDTCFKKHDLLQSTKNKKENVFYIPAQRILSIADGRPKNFMEYDISSPYVLRNFSETLRLFFQHGMSNEQIVFPLNNRLKGGLKKSFNQTIFHGGQIVIDEHSGQKKMRMKIGESSLPFMTWSAGQKEFMPLLMATYCLTGPAIKTINREQYEYVVIEEPEMGLHPKAIQSVIIQILEFIQSGYKVIVSTHSTIILEFAWVLRMIQLLPEERQEDALCELFEVKINSNVRKIFKGIGNKDVKTFFFSHTKDGVRTQDISSLDIASLNANEAEWGGLSHFASKASQVVSKYMMLYGKEYE
jgi:predicted ATP-dependent endonuclease of OLD family